MVHSLREGQIVAGRFRLVRCIGAGGQAVVWEAAHVVTRRRFALKLLLDAKDPLRRARFLREARSASAVCHPAVVEIFDILDTELPVIVMELLAGETLGSRLQRVGRLSLADAAQILIPVCDALSAAHALGIVHRDLKPENIFLCDEASAPSPVKVLDFGIAKTFALAAGDTESGALTADGHFIGTPEYMAPEQLFAERDLDNRVDAWAIGAILYEMLFGARLVDRNEMASWLRQIASGQVPPLADRLPTLPTTVGELLGRLLEPNRQRRLADLHAVRDALLRVARDAAGAKPVAVAPPHADTTGLPPRPRLLGRAALVAELRALLFAPNVRLVTLSGAGGMGKTSIALELAHDVAHEFEDGAAFVALAPVRDAEMVLPAIASALGVSAERLPDVLRLRRQLVVVDNFEQVIGAAPQLAALVDISPHVKWVVTTRTLLRVRQERELVVPPLDLPTGSDSSRALQSSAVALFVERAVEAQRQFSPTTKDTEAIIAICKQLDGMPLAIELAAARVRMFSPSAIRERLARGALDLLTGGPRDAPLHQRALRDTIAWSYELLAEEERRAFRALSVFRGGCDLLAASAVLDRDELATLALLEALVDKSLLRIRDERDEPRFFELEMVREFAAEKLEQAGELPAVRERHARYFAALATSSSAKLHGPEQAHAFPRFVRELDNIAAAISHAISSGDAVSAAELALGSTAAWELDGQYGRALSQIEAVAAVPGHSSSTETRLAVSRARMRFRLGRFDGEDALQLRQAIELLKSASLIDDVFEGLWLLRHHLHTAGEIGRLRELSDEMIAMAACDADARHLTMARVASASVLLETNELRHRAEAEAQRAREMAERAGDAHLVGHVYTLLGEIYRIAGDVDTALAMYEKDKEIGERYGWPYRVAVAAGNIAACTAHRDERAARKSAVSAFRIWRQIGDLRNVSQTAAVFFAERAPDPNQAARLAAGATRWFEALGFRLSSADRPMFDALLTRLSTELGEAVLERELAAGRAMQPDDVIEAVEALCRAWEL